MSKTMNEKNRAENAIDAARLSLSPIGISPSGSAKARLAFTFAEDLFEQGQYGLAARQAFRSLRMSRSDLSVRGAASSSAPPIVGTKAA